MRAKFGFASSRSPELASMLHSLCYSPAYRMVRAAVLLPLVAAVPFVVLLLIAGVPPVLWSSRCPGHAGRVRFAVGRLVGRGGHGAAKSRPTRANLRSVHLWLPPATLAAAWLVLLVPGSSPLGVAGLTVLLVVAEAVVWGRGHLGNLERAQPGAGGRDRRGLQQRQPLGPVRRGQPQAAAIETSGTPAENVTAQFVRQREPDGRDAPARPKPGRLYRRPADRAGARGLLSAALGHARVRGRASRWAPGHRARGPGTALRRAVRRQARRRRALSAQSVWIEWAAIEAGGPTEPDRREA